MMRVDAGHPDVYKYLWVEQVATAFLIEDFENSSSPSIRDGSLMIGRDIS